MNDKGEILIQQRSSNRKMFPNKWSNTGGACDAFEISLQTVLRELKEELVQAARWVTLEEWLEILEQGEGIKSSTDYFIKYLNEDF